MSHRDLIQPADSGGRGYPRPQLVRKAWQSLNGTWQFALDARATWRGPHEVEWERQITVPFSPETPASGVRDTSFFKACWYRRTVPVPSLNAGRRMLLHFGAVDYHATVWAEGQLVGSHEGGYTPFWFDVTSLAAGKASIDVVVRAEDDPQDLAKPRGKQDWQLEPHSIWYPRTSWIWQTVWAEVVPDSWINSVRWTPNLARWEIGLEVRLNGLVRDDLRLRVSLRCGDQLIADDTYRVVGGEVQRRIALSDPGIDDYRNELLWSPESPTLIQADLELWAGRGVLLDEVS